MNKIYKVVWSKVKNCYVVVSEIAKNVISGSVKSAKIGAAPVVKGMALGALMALVITGNAWAAGGYYNGHYYIFSNYKEFTENTSMSTWRALFTGDNEPGVYHTVNANGNTITLTGKISGSVPLNEYGFSYHGGIMRLYDASKIEFAGDYKSGIYAYVGNYAQFTDIGDIVQTSGSFSEGYFINNYGSTVEIDANNIDVNGGITSTYCDYTAQGVVYGTTDINVSENITLTGNINAYQQSTIDINANQSNITGDITSKSGSVVSITANTNNFTGNMHTEGENSRINITANSQGNVVGDVSALSGGGVSIDLAGSGSSFIGSSTTDDTNGGVVLDLTQGATWYVTGDSKVDSIIGDDFNIIAANGMKDINLTIECGNHNLDVDDYYDHTNSNLRGVNMFLVAPTEDGLTDGVSVNSDSDVTINSGEHGVAILNGGRVNVVADDVKIDSVKAAIWVDDPGTGIASITASGNVNLNSEQRFAVNNESKNNGVIEIVGNNVTIISEDRTAVKAGGILGREGKNGIVNINGNNIDIQGASQDDTYGNEHNASVVYAQGGTTINLSATGTLKVSDTEKIGGNTISVYEGGTINIKDTANVVVDGKVYANGEGSKVDIAASNVNLSDIVLVEDSGEINITGFTDITISNNDSSVYAIHANKGTVNITDDLNVNVNANSGSAYGIKASKDSDVNIGSAGKDISVTTTGKGDWSISTAFLADGVNSKINVVANNLTVNSQTDALYHAGRSLQAKKNGEINVVADNIELTGGINTDSDGRIDILGNTSISVSGKDNVSFSAVEAGSGDITITGNTNISANGSSLGVYSYGGDINIIGDTSILMETGDQRGYAIKSNGGHITIDGNTNVVANSDSDWVYAVTADGGNIKITDGLNAKITGDAAYGIEAKNSSNIEIGDAQSNIYISVIGMDNSNGYADAVYADNSNVEIVGDEVTITTSANGSLQQGIGLRATNNGTVNVEANTVDLTGRIIATNNGIVNVTGITTVSIEKEEGVGYAIQASGGNVQIADSVDVVVTGGAARGIEANDGAKIYLGGDGKDVSLSATATGASADAILVYGKDTEVDVKADKFTVNAIGTFSPYTGGYSSYSLQVKDGAIVDVDANTVNIAGSLYAGQYYGVQEANTAIIDLTEVGDIGIKSVLTNLAVQAEKEGMILVGSKDSKTNITGDITAFSGGSVNAVFGTKDSAFTGATKIGHEGDNKDGSIVLDFNDGATWYITEDSKVSSVIGDNFNIVAADGVNDVELTISGDHNFDIADYESTNVNIKGVDLIAIEPDGSGLSGNKTIISDSDVTFDVGKNGVYVSGSDKVSVNADNIMFNSVEDTILLQGNGEVSIKGSEEIVLNSKQGYVVNNDAENEGDITINGKTVTLISQDNGVVKSGNKVGNGSTYIGATNVTIEGSSNNQQSGVVHAQSGEIKIVGYDVSITDKEGDGYALLVDKETGAMEIGFTSGSTELSIDGDIKATEGSFKMTAGFDSVIRGSINTEDNSSSNVTLYGTTWYATGNSAMYRFRGNDSTIAVDLNKTDDIAIKNNYSTNTIVKATGVDLKGNAKEVLSGMDEKLRDIVTVESNIGNAEALTYKSAVIDTVLYGDVELSDGKVITNMDTDDVVVKGDVFAGNNTSIKGNANAIELLNTAVVGKANVSDVYTKTEVDTALVGKADRADISALDSQVEAFSTTRDEKGKVTGATITGIVNAHDFSAGNYTLRQVGSDLNTLDRLAIKNGQYMIDDRTDSLSMMSQSADRFYLTTENIDRTSYTSMGLEEGRFYISNHNIDGTASAELYVSGTKVGVNGDFVVSDWNGKKFTVASNGSVTGGTYNGVEIKNVNNNAVIGGINLSTLATQQDTEELQGNIDAEITNREVADIALESKVTEAYKSADEVLRSGYETADNALSGRINEAQASIALKANIADVYTKTVADAKFAVKASTLAGYGITDAYTQAEVNAKIADATSGLLTDANLTGKADKADTLSGYGIADAYTKDEVNAKIADATSGLLTDANLVGKADKADTLSGYGITDAYTKAEVDSEIVAMNTNLLILSLKAELILSLEK